MAEEDNVALLLWCCLKKSYKSEKTKLFCLHPIDGQRENENINYNIISSEYDAMKMNFQIA